LGQKIDPEYKEQIYKLKKEQEEAAKRNKFENPDNLEVKSFNTWQGGRW
jgi:hypothetical protein